MTRRRSRYLAMLQAASRFRVHVAISHGRRLGPWVETHAYVRWSLCDRTVISGTVTHPGVA
jgi:hypothetical protein